MTKKTQIGTTDLFVNPVGLGTNKVGGHNLFSNLDENVGKDIVRTAINNGVDFIDTAYIYGMGRSEELIGEVIKETGKRSEIAIATKVSSVLSEDGMTNDNSPEFLKQEVENSLKRLQTDYIDMLFIHQPDEDTPKDEAVGALKQLKDEGKIRSIGISNFSLDQLKQANKDGYVDVFQDQYNLLSREAEKELLPYTAKNEISFIPYFPLAAGLLTGKYNKDTEFKDIRSSLPYFQGEVFTKSLKKVEQVRNIANEKSVEVAHLVLAWYLTQDSIDTIIPGANNTEQVLSNLKVVDVQLTAEEIQAIDDIFS